ncbi:MAG TPA: asparagine synthase (glutamine-hydrolyzing) [Rhizomicrobium sp.]|jgi:asparagine synthase (glutamine-hydrolysing)|nr:asparagine synthase (glutamine-hydrolyzing) [Rhizomicrobium sp.]
MCGIAGEVRFDGGVTAPPLEAMARRLRHRGPDDEGLWLEAGRRCGFSFRRLSIIDLSPLAHQPMVDPQTGNVIVFNGEVYNFRELRRECEQAGAKFRSQGDAEVVLALYRRFGPDCVRRLRGMFALAIWDARRSALFLARDRFGKKPLNYALTPEGLVFCSEIGPLSRHPAVPRGEDGEALELFLQLLFVPAPWTIYKSIRKLPPAHWAMFSQGGFRLERYWEIDYRRKIAITDEDALEAFEEKFTEAVRLRTIADVPLGALLSGGVDSSVVVAAMAKLSAAPVKTFSVGFEEEAFNELPHAGEVARICGTDHHEQVVTGEVGALLPKLVRHYGEPFGDASAIPSFLVCETARAKVTVALNGDGGDELLGGYPRYSLSQPTLWSSRLLGPLVSAGRLASMAANHPAGGPHFLSRAASRLVRDGLHPELGALVNYRNHWDDPSRRNLLLRHDPSLLPGWRDKWLARAQAHASNPVDRMLWFDNHTRLPDDLLAKMDIASMHCSLEARSPLLDHELAEFCASLPLRLKLRNRTGKYLLKQLAAKTFGRAFAGRTKQGFGIPLGKWLRGPLRSRLRDVLSDRGLMEPFDAAVIARTAGEFFSDRRQPDHSSKLWALFVYGLWREAQGATESPASDTASMRFRELPVEPALQ